MRYRIRYNSDYMQWQVYSYKSDNWIEMYSYWNYLNYRQYHGY